MVIFKKWWGWWDRKKRNKFLKEYLARVKELMEIKKENEEAAERLKDMISANSPQWILDRIRNQRSRLAAEENAIREWLKEKGGRFKNSLKKK